MADPRAPPRAWCSRDWSPVRRRPCLPAEGPPPHPSRRVAPSEPRSQGTRRCARRGSAMGRAAPHEL